MRGEFPDWLLSQLRRSFGDDLVLSETPCVRQLLDLHERHKPAAVIAFQEVERSETYRYGIAKLKNDAVPREMELIVETAREVWG